MFFGSCPPPTPPPHAPSSSSSLCFIHSPNSSFLLFISFLISFQRQREASKSGFVVIVTRDLAAFEEENSGARYGDDAYCHDNVVFFFHFLSRSVVSCPFFTSVSTRELFKLISSVPRSQQITDALVCAATGQVFRSKWKILRFPIFNEHTLEPQ